MERQFERIAGRLALDFVNTMSGYRPSTPRDNLDGYGDLLSWAKQADLLGPRAAALLAREAAAHPRRAEQALLKAARLREALHDLVLASVAREPQPPAQLAEVNAWVAEALAQRRLLPQKEGGLALGWHEPLPGDLLFFLRPVAVSAAEVLVTDARGDRLRMCAESEVGSCGWFFVDESRNGKRRFCTTGDCGNRAKQRRHYRRVTGAGRD